MFHKYSQGEKFLHKVALNSSVIKKMSFDLDCLFNQAKNVSDNHVFISGLARAGTTILMKTFYNTNQFVSLTYRNMPFVLMPNLWKLLSKPFYKIEEGKERAHGDGIVVSFDSPEAFEEVFWQTFTGKEYITPSGLAPYEIDGEVLTQFRTFVSNVLASSDIDSQNRYLSKNNSNILRLKYISHIFPKSLILIPFRDPIQQAISLYNQHLKFSALHDQEPFALEYFNWLGHHEFGAGHLPFLFSQKVDLNENGLEPDDINYWLASWINTYHYLSENTAGNYLFVCFESLCNSPAETLAQSFDLAGLSIQDYDFSHISELPPKKSIDGISAQLSKQALGIYQHLREM